MFIIVSLPLFSSSSNLCLFTIMSILSVIYIFLYHDFVAMTSHKIRVSNDGYLFFIFDVKNIWNAVNFPY